MCGRRICYRGLSTPLGRGGPAGGREPRPGKAGGPPRPEHTAGPLDGTTVSQHAYYTRFHGILLTPNGVLYYLYHSHRDRRCVVDVVGDDSCGDRGRPPSVFQQLRNVHNSDF